MFLFTFYQNNSHMNEVVGAQSIESFFTEARSHAKFQDKKCLSFSSYCREFATAFASNTLIEAEFFTAKWEKDTT